MNQLQQLKIDEFMAQFRGVAQSGKPNILVIWGDDIGTWNISHNNRGMMGYQTPNIDRIAKEGVSFTDYYGQQSCTAGRAAFIGGNVPVRTGMTKVGLPAAKEGWQKTDVTMATVRKSQGYATGQFGGPMQVVASRFLLTLKDYPPSQAPGDWSLKSLEDRIKHMTPGGR